MGTIDLNNLAGRGKSIALLLAGNCCTLRKEYKVLQVVVKKKRFHNYLITLKAKSIVI